jgi:hypothetical protein
MCCCIPRHYTNKERSLLGCTIFWLIVAAVCTGLAVGLSALITYVIQINIYNVALLDSPDRRGYQTWVTTEYSGAPPLLQCYSFFNLTNKDNVQFNGTKPIYKEVGPYCYRENRTRLNVTWSDDRTLVSFTTMTQYLLYPSKTNGNPYTDRVTNINPAYIGLLANANGEFSLRVGFTGVQIRLFFQFFNATLLDDARLYYTPNILLRVRDYLIERHMNTTGVNRTDALEYFYAVWANDTSVFVSNSSDTVLWNAMKVSLWTKITGISRESAKLLWNPANKLALTYNESSFINSVIKKWYQAPDNSSLREVILQEFRITFTQLVQITTWLMSPLFRAMIDTQLAAQFGVDSVYDLSFLHWGQGTVAPASVVSLYPQHFPPLPPPEFYYFAKLIGQPNPTFSLNQSTYLLAGPNGIFLPQNFGALMMAVTQAERTQNWSTIQKMWGLTRSDFDRLLLYLLDVSARWSSHTLQNLFSEGYDLFTTKTVHEWLWTAHDKLLALMSGTDGRIAFSLNDTDESDAFRRHGGDTVHTGKGDINKVQTLYRWNGTTVIEGVFNGPVNVSGQSDAGQYAPFVTRDSVIYVWVNEFLRPAKLVFTSNVTFKGFDLLRFTLSNETWEPNEYFAQNIYGALNMTKRYRNTPIFLTNPHFYLMNPKWREKVGGIMSQGENDTDKVDIEPHLGKVFRVVRALQINIYIDKESAWFNWWNPNVPKGLFYPLVIVRQMCEISDELAEEVRNTLLVALKLQSVGFWVLAGIAVGSFLIGFALFMYSVPHLKRKAGYEAINEAPDS